MYEMQKKLSECFCRLKIPFKFWLKVVCWDIFLPSFSINSCIFKQVCTMTGYGNVGAEFSLGPLPGLPSGRRETLVLCTDDTRKVFTFSVLVVSMSRLSLFSKSGLKFFPWKRVSATFSVCQRI